MTGVKLSKELEEASAEKEEMNSQPKSNLRREYEARMGVVAGDLTIYSEAGKRVYYEDSDGFWTKAEYNEAGAEVYFESSDGFWTKSEYSEIGAEVYSEYSKGYWTKHEYNEAGAEVYYENSTGFCTSSFN